MKPKHKHYHTTNKPTFFLLFFILVSSTQLPPTHPKTHPSDIKSLSLFIHSIHPSSILPGSCLSTWSFTLDPCDNLFSSHFTCGLRCDFIDTQTNLSHITDITLDSANYTGNLYITNLPHLQTLQLPDNSLAGPIPSSLSTLPSLHRLILSSNSFSHRIPPSLSELTLLSHLSLDNNRLTGPIPSSFNSLTSLTTLQLQNNRLSHSIPPNLSSLRNLTSLDLSHNRISFSSLLLPDSLISFSARNNTLSGGDHIPTIINQLQHLPYLQVLDLSYNQFSGQISTLLFQHQSLQQLSLSHNRLSSIPRPLPSTNLHRNSTLIAIDLSHNRITGPLPDFFTQMPTLSALSLEYNRFSGGIPSHYAKKVEAAAAAGGTSSFRRLLLGGNYLFGPIPGPILQIKPGLVNVSLVDNCLLYCPENLFFCKGGVQKPLSLCRKFIH